MIRVLPFFWTLRCAVPLMSVWVSPHLFFQVQSVSRSSPSGPWLVKTSASDDARSYRAVILAAPFHQTGIRFASSPQIAAVPDQAYVHLHVTLLTTTRRSANASYFNLPQGSAVPAMVLTTYNGARRDGGDPEPEFNSLSYLREVRTADLGEWRNDQGQKEWVVKIFSKRRVSDAWLEAMFGDEVRWVLRKEWDAYPVLTPTTEFPPIELGEGLYYVNAFEPYAAATMLSEMRFIADFACMAGSSLQWRRRFWHLETS